MSLIKNVITTIVKPFGHICNVSFQTGVFPSKMKIAKVDSLFKCGEKNVFTNYRPISLLPQFSKILEKLYNNRMDKFLKKNDILSPSQYGFRSNMSTTHALLELVEEIISSLDNNKYAIGVFVDLKGGGVKHSNNHSPNIITYHLQYISPLYNGRNATVIL